jgi:hypothetical protein
MATENLTVKIIGAIWKGSAFLDDVEKTNLRDAVSVAFDSVPGLNYSHIMIKEEVNKIN